MEFHCQKQDCHRQVTYVCHCFDIGLYLCQKHISEHQGHQIQSLLKPINRNSSKIVSRNLTRLQKDIQYKIQTLSTFKKEFVRLFKASLDEKIDFLQSCRMTLDQYEGKYRINSQIVKLPRMNVIQRAFIQEPETLKAQTWETPQVRLEGLQLNFQQLVVVNIQNSIFNNKGQIKDIKKMTKVSPRSNRRVDKNRTIIQNRNQTYRLSQSTVIQKPKLCFASSQQLNIIDLQSEQTKSSAIDTINASSRILAVSDNLIVITGGLSYTSLCMVMNITTYKVEFVNQLNTGRYDHAMAMFADKPGVIGGWNGKNYLNSCEILDGERWIRTNSLGVARKELAACSAYGKVYAAGGEANQDLNVIQEWQAGEWSVLDVRLAQPLSNLGMFFYNESLVIVGGIKRNRESKEVYSIDLRTKEYKTLPNCVGICSFDQNNWMVYQKKKYGVSSRGRLVSVKV